MAIEWSPDYCLSCDRQCPAGAAYCSPSCKLADAFESESNSSSPLSIASSAPPAPSNGFYLPPALNFSAMGNYSSSSPNKSPVSSKTPPPTHLVSHTSRLRSGSQQQQQQQQPQQSSNGLHQSNSRTSLSSMPAQYGSHESSYLSDKAAKELRDYENAFDQVRYRRRQTVSGY